MVESTKQELDNAAEAISSNVAKITALEEDALARRTGGERMGDTVARHAGRMWFLLLHVVWFVVWIVINAGAVPGLRTFDPFPYPFLTLVVSLESIFLSLFILMSQNRATRQADSRSHLDLQINLLAEQESTKILQMLQQLCALHGLAVARDPEVDVLTKSTKPEELLGELNERLPEN